MLNLASDSDSYKAVPIASGAKDYDAVRRAIAYLSENWLEQPDLDDLADHSRLRALSIVIACRNSFGLRPHHRLNNFWQCAALSPM